MQTYITESNRLARSEKIVRPRTDHKRTTRAKRETIERRQQRNLKIRSQA